ncbi:hypothetical protein ILUMI_09120 [Ignelater luminosus]|uniref:Uncharacterized protein n=1 Tax=Ignelater luminosus TaxID=2038154 RepID=A0A8K0D0L3_IGNLU|nr:hypothetical protein ILUMI_09120 [Ignelater luminosus]
MPASVQKSLIHGAEVMDSLLLPIGQLVDEEALEVRHKECRYYREHNTRKISRSKNMEDLLHILLVLSDPVISSQRRLSRKKVRHLSQEVIHLLQNPEILVRSIASEISDTDGDSSESDSDADFD